MASASALVLAGCGFGSSSSSPTGASTGTIGGILHGGPNPIVGATVTLYATQSNGYGGAGLSLASTSTGSDGSFSFAGKTYNCPSGQQAYITAAGGNTGGNAANPNSLLMAALGDCSTVNSNTHIWMNELSTVAAGYALSNFIKVSGTGSTAVVDVSAPTTNNATLAAAGCTGVGAALSCNAAGLAHAFQNAANLVDAVEQGATSPTGAALAAVPGNSNSVTPALLVNTLGNILQSCVNSTGGVANDGATNCGTLFGATTPPATSQVTPVVPTNTLQAVVNLAKYPSLTPANVTALFGLQGSTIFYTPNLSAVPNDYSMAIIYRGPTASTNYVYGFYSTLDASDNVYTVSELANGGTSAGTPYVSEISSNGANGMQFTGTLTGALCVAGSPCVAAADTSGHLWVANTNSTALNVYELSTATGTLTQTFNLPTGTAPNSVAVDKAGDVFVTSANITSNDLYEKTPASGSFVALTANGTAETQSVASPEYIAVDASGSLWNTNYNSSTVSLTYNQNTGTTSAEAFGNAFVTVQAATTPGQPYSIMLDGSGNAWVNNITSIYEVTPGATTAAATYAISGIGGNATAVNPSTATSARFSTLDGDGNIFLPDNSKSVLWQFIAATKNFIYLSPCAGATGTCLTATTNSRPIGAPRNAVTDSTGSIWVTNPVASATNATYGNVTQIIGTGAPTWGQLSYGKPGVRP